MTTIGSQSVLRDAEPFDPQKLGRYTVVQVFFEFPEEPADFKYFVVLKNESSGRCLYCRCVKATSRVEWYEARAELLSGCVIYEVGQSVFKQRTAISPHEFHNIAHDHFERYARKRQFKFVGTMPTDFHGRFIQAILNSRLLKPKDAKTLLAAIGVPPGNN